jgi:hypothetical protein
MRDRKDRLVARKLDDTEVYRLDRLALKWVDDDNAPEHGWALRGIIDSLQGAGFDPYQQTLYKDYYCQTYHHQDAQAAVIDYLEGRTDEYHLFHFDIGSVVDDVDNDIEERDARDTWGGDYDC